MLEIEQKILVIFVVNKTNASIIFFLDQIIEMNWPIILFICSVANKNQYMVLYINEFYYLFIEILLPCQ